MAILAMRQFRRKLRLRYVRFGGRPGLQSIQVENSSLDCISRTIFHFLSVGCAVKLLTVYRFLFNVVVRKVIKLSISILLNIFVCKLNCSSKCIRRLYIPISAERRIHQKYAHLQLLISSSTYFIRIKLK